MPRFSARQQTTFAVLLFLSLLPFVRLGEGDLRNDEVRYVSRAQDMVAQGTLLPDTPLMQFSGRQPPLAIWAMALSIKILGFSNTAARLPAAMSLAVLIAAFFILARRVVLPRTAIGVTAILASSWPILNFAQTAQLDLPWLALVVAAMTLFVTGWDTRDPRWMLGAGLLFGLSCIAKLHITALPLAALCVWGAIEWRSDPASRAMLRGAATRIIACIVVVWAPWVVWMVARYGREFLDLTFGFDLIARSSGGADALPKQTGNLFYVNALGVGFPLVAVAAVLAVHRVGEWIRTRLPMDEWERLMWIWFVVPFLAISLMQGKEHNYLLICLPPLAILVGAGVEALMRKGVPIAWRAAALGGVVLTCAWSASQVVRDGAREWFAPGSARAPVPTEPFLIAACAAGGLMILVAVMLWRWPGGIQRIWWRIPTAGAALLVAARVVVAAVGTGKLDNAGARLVAETVPRSGPVLLLTVPLRDQYLEVQFHCYDPTRTLFRRLIIEDRRAFAVAPRVIPDSIHAVVVEKPDAYFATDSTGLRSGANLRTQNFVLLIRTFHYDVWARGLLRDS